ncbi:protein SEMI-ROLLED LEAF 2 [Brassica rapa]|uniref:protein SEMI-ROLLED LEAF 2 n=1 Tax=Brassica campestris TaxID=3711 RepID=UPI0004F14E88|nr:protein SEMI-ROLLED LEAF 2 [Brassica rapa]XP_033141495.1 protein SEMI-ROLLED LEAF 2 [Brassica rapa]
MGAVARTVFPVCESLCCFCPALRARSRHPVKRYKQLLADIFPRSPDEQPNDRKISKLCEYAAKNPLRIPKITTYLEQRCYKELRLEQFHSVKTVMCIYKKLLVACNEQMSLFASSYLGLIHILLDQSRHDEMRVLGCEAIYDFVTSQTEGTYMFNLDGLIPKICPLAHELGEEERTIHLCSAGLQALSSLVWFMGEFSHISVEFDNVVSVVLENYGGVVQSSTGAVQQQDSNTASELSPAEAETRIASWTRIVDDRGKAIVSVEDSKNPKFWSRVCLHNLAKLAKEATTVRRVLESLFRYFDFNEVWSTDNGLALYVLQDVQLLIERSGQNTHFLLSILIKHLDHKNVLKKPKMQLDIVYVATALAQQTKVQPSVAIIGALSDMIRHLRKSIHCSLDDSNLGNEMIQYNLKFETAVEQCLVQLSQKVGDAGPILDIMAVMLESMSNITVMARTLISAVFRTAQIIAAIPNLSYENKAFPDALFHQLLQAMVCADHESRMGAHRIFSVVLVPSSVCPNSVPKSRRPADMQRTLSRTVSVFSSSAALFRKLKMESDKSADGAAKIERVSTLSRSQSRFASRGESFDEEEPKNNTSSVLSRLKSSYSRSQSVKRNPSSMVSDQDPLGGSEEKPVIPLRLSSHQICLLLSSIWVQSLSPHNMPQNYEAIANTYSLVLLFGRTKNSSNEVLVWSFQLAFSLRNLSLGGPLQPSRRRSLFTLATSMIIFAARAFNIPPLVNNAKTALQEKTVDPFLQLVEDSKLDAVFYGQEEQPAKGYGSKEDDDDALISLVAIEETTQNQPREHYAAMIMKFLGKLSDQDSSSIREQLVSDFIPIDGCPVGTQLTESPVHVHRSEDKNNKPREMDETQSLIPEIDAAPTPPEDQLALDTQPNAKTAFLLSIDELLSAVSQTTAQLGRYSVSDPPDMTYTEMAGHCEALLMGKQEKMSFMSAKSNKFSNQTKESTSPALPSGGGGNPFVDQPNSWETMGLGAPAAASNMCVTEYQNHPPFFNPPSSTPFDNFLKPVGSS